MTFSNITDWLYNWTENDQTTEASYEYDDEQFEKIRNDIEMLNKVTKIAGLLYIVLTVIGVVLNAFVLTRLAMLACSDKERFKNGCGMPLAAMSLADLISLFCTILAVFNSAFIPHDSVPEFVHNVNCKITLFVVHTMTGFSTWCWLFVSALRYMAVYHPLWHISRWSLGQRSLSTMLLLALLLNSWLLFAVVSYKSTCGEQSFITPTRDINRLLHASEIFYSYVIPVFITFALDIRVILSHPPGLASTIRKQNAAKCKAESKTSSSQSNINHARCCGCADVFLKNTQNNTNNSLSLLARFKQKVEFPSFSSPPKGNTQTSAVSVQATRARSAVWRWLAITSLNLLLNSPDNILRFIVMFDMRTSLDNSMVKHFIALVARLLYFAQFCFNAAYLTRVVYRRNIRLRPAKGARKKSTGQCFSNNTCTTTAMVRKQSVSLLLKEEARLRSTTLNDRSTRERSHVVCRVSFSEPLQNLPDVAVNNISLPTISTLKGKGDDTLQQLEWSI